MPGAGATASRVGGFGLGSVAAALGSMRAPTSSSSSASTPAHRPSSFLAPEDAAISSGGGKAGVLNKLTYPDQSGSKQPLRRSSQPGPGIASGNHAAHGRPILSSASATPFLNTARGSGGGGASSSSVGSYNPNSLAMLDPNELFGADAGPYVPVESGNSTVNAGAGWSDVAILRLLESNGQQEQAPPQQHTSSNHHAAMPASAPAASMQTNSAANPFPGITPAQVAQIYQSLAGNPEATVAAAAAVAQSYQPSYISGQPRGIGRAYSQQQSTGLQSGSPFSFSTQDSQSVFSSLFESVPGLGIHTGGGGGDNTYEYAGGDSLSSQLAAADTSGLTSFFEHFLVDQGDDDIDVAAGGGGSGSNRGGQGGPDFGTPATNISIFSSSQPKEAGDFAPSQQAAPVSMAPSRPAKLARAETIAAIMTTKPSTREHSRGRTPAGSARGRRMSSGVDEAAASAAMPPPAPPRGGVGAHRNSSRSRTRQSAYARPPGDKYEPNKSVLHAAIDKVQAQAATESNPLSSRSSMSHHTDSPGSSQSVQSAALSPVMGGGGGESRAPKSGSSRRHSMDEARPPVKNDDDAAMSTVDEVTIEEPDDDGEEAEAEDILRPLNAEELALARKSRRRLSHNEVERKRRETINEKIQELEALLPADVVANALAAREVEVKEEEDEAMEGKKGSNSGRARSRKTIKKAALPERLCKGTVLCLTVDLVK